MSRRLIGAVLAVGALAAPAAPAVAAPASAAPASVQAVTTPRPAPTRTTAAKPAAKKTAAKTVSVTRKSATTRAVTTKKGATTTTVVRRSTSQTTLRPGSKGPQVLALQKRLSSLGYWVGKPNGYYGHGTTQAVMAVQKVAGLGRDGVAGPATRAAVARGVRPSARTKSGRAVEIDLRRQVVVIVDGGRVRTVLNTSTGTAATPTPKGTYRIYRGYGAGWRTAPLGKLYRPKYFHRGYAIHGVNDGGIPGVPASHGCARVSTAAMDMLWSRGGLRNGDKVLVY